MYEATNGSFLDCDEVAPDSPAAEQQGQPQHHVHETSDFGSGTAVFGQQQFKEKFKRFPCEVYEQEEGRRLFESEVEKLVDTKPPGKQLPTHLA